MAASGNQLSPPRRSRRTRLRHSIEALGPYQSLVLLLIPTSLVEPLKLIAVAIVGHGHWITGAAVILGAYLASFLLVERLFRIVKPKLLMLGWFAHLWSYVVFARSKAIAIFRKP
jgi:hypothetical protein